MRISPGYASLRCRLSDRGGPSLVPSVRRLLRQCRLRRRLLGLPHRRLDGQSRAVVSNWRSRLTSEACSAPTTALCALVMCDQQCSLAKVASGSAVAERTYVSRIECGRWANLPVEASRPHACLRLRTRGGSGPAPGEVFVPFLLRGPDSVWGSGTPWEVWAPRLLRSGAHLLWDMWRHLTRTRAGSGSGAVGSAR